jgi:ribonuclease HII
MRKKNYPWIYKNQYEKASWSQGHVVCGIDEVGRGCLAGPLVTAAVILPVNKTSPLLKDSKETTLEGRREAFRWIQRHCWYSVGIVHNRLVDQHNIYQATLIAMKKALVTLLATAPVQPEAILVDAMPLDLHETHYKNIPIYAFCQAERKSSSIAAASIVAKITRDQIMDRFDLIIPGYHFDAHKGYATKAHKQALGSLDRCVLHRMSFLENTLTTESADEYQQTIC